MKKIALSGQRGQGKYALVDDEDYEYLSRFRWFWGPTSTYATGYVTGDGRMSLMHKLVINVPAGYFADHINGDRLDNRRSNLRVVTGSQNNWNMGASSRNQWGLRGVSYHKKAGKWEAYLGIGGNAKAGVRTRKIYLGLYTSPEAAGRAYNVAAIQFYGDYARLNDL
jgi:hypothetical protein